MCTRPCLFRKLIVQVLLPELTKCSGQHALLKMIALASKYAGSAFTKRSRLYVRGSNQLTACCKLQLRRKGPVHWPPTMLPENARVPIEGLSGSSFDIEVIINRGTSFVAGLMLQSWSSVQGSAAVLYDWENSVLEVRLYCSLCCIQ
jgi:hypothetical protein